MAFSEGSPSTPRSPGRCRVPSAGDGGLSLRARASARSSEGTWGGWVVQTKVENLFGTFPCTVYPRDICLN